MSDSSLRLLLADSSDLLLLGMKTHLAAYPDCDVLAATGDFTPLLLLTGKLQPDVIVFGDGLDLDRDLWEQITALKVASPLTALILVNNRVSGLLIRDLLQHGLSGILCKQDLLESHLYPAILAARHHRPYLSPTASTEYLIAMQSPHAHGPLDSEARQILNLLAHGEHIGQISQRLGIHKRRIYWVRDKLRRRFAAQTNEHLILRAATEGFIYPRD